MLRIVLAVLLAAVSVSGAAQTRIPPSTRAYAPENIGSLPVSDQIRVIEMEYRDQSGGRELPDDQLDFYLDQVKYSRWTFSRIKTDIATSLRGSGGGTWYPPAGGGWKPTSIICSSTDRRYRECRTPFRGRARLQQNISNTRCVEGRNWGSRQGLVWVDDGCRGRFIDSGNGWGGGQWDDKTFRCESEGQRQNQCRKPYRGTAHLVRQLSNARCTEGSSWGQNVLAVWVSRGCRAEFSMRDGDWGGNQGGNWDYSVTCASTNSRYTTCAWDRNRGRPRLIERLSNARCDEGQDWGYDLNRGLWVDNGCRARFGVR